MTARYRLPAFFAAALALHLALLFSPAFKLGTYPVEAEAGVMKLTDLGETPRAAPPASAPSASPAPSPASVSPAPSASVPPALPASAPSASSVPQGAPEEESGGFEPSSGSEQQAAGASSETTAESGSGFAFAQGEAGDEYLPLDWVSKPPLFSDEAIRRRLRYPPLALRANIEGLVYLELFVDRSGAVKRISILNEDPPGRGFGEAALRAFEGLRGVPAELNGSPVAVRYRYPLRFTIR